MGPKPRRPVRVTRPSAVAALGLQVDRQADEPLFRQIASQLRQSIETGRLAVGTRLPPERLFAVALGVNRTTVLNAYDELKRDGLIEGHVGRGTQVTAPPDRPHAGLPWSDGLRPASADPLIRDLLGAEDDDIVSLALGLPGSDLLPTAELAALHAEVFAELGPRAFMHTPTEGVPALREALAERLRGRGMAVEPHEVLVTSGSQQALDLVARTLLSPGDSVVVEEPTYVGMLQTLRAVGARPVAVPIDGEGMRVDRLEALLGRVRPRLIYTLPTFQNPSGTVLSLARRRRLLELAAQYQVPIVEDDPYHELRYEGEPLPSLKALDRRGIVFHVATASKILCPGFRLGWLAGPAPVVRQLAIAKQAADLHPAAPGQWVLARALAGGLLDEHLARVRPAYLRRRDALLEALGTTGALGVVWERPQGGIFLWGRLPAAVSMARLLAEAARERVAFLPGSVFSSDGAAAGGLRLNFSALPVDRLREGARRLARALTAAARVGTPSTYPGAGLRPIV
jgi:DNA-binding transcriptional MocR family regulator